MSELRLATAQCASEWNDITGNVARHCALAELAAAHGAQFIIFPELSLTGYPSDRAPEPVARDDARLLPLRALARRAGLVITAGAPISQSGRMHIAVLSFMPDGRVCEQTKVHLHPGEERFFAPGVGAPPLAISDDQVAIAICAESNRKDHIERAAHAGASVYAISALQGIGTYEETADRYGRWAAACNIAVLFANHAVPTGNYETAARSAVWNPSGECLATAPRSGAAVVMAVRNSQGWHGEVL